MKASEAHNRSATVNGDHSKRGLEFHMQRAYSRIRGQADKGGYGVTLSFNLKAPTSHRFPHEHADAIERRLVSEGYFVQRRLTADGQELACMDVTWKEAQS